MGERLTHAGLGEDRVVSVWVGRLTTEAALDEYLRGDFRRDFGFAIDPAAGPEVWAGREPVPVEDLLVGFSGFRRFGPAAFEAADAAGVRGACCAVVFYALRYRPEWARPAEGAPLTFLGTFEVG